VCIAAMMELPGVDKRPSVDSSCVWNPSHVPKRTLAGSCAWQSPIGHDVQVSLILFTGIFDSFVSGFEEFLVESQYAMLGILTFFALVHSGLAYFRPYGTRRHPRFCVAASCIW
jgi:hypothetical protein